MEPEGYMDVEHDDFPEGDPFREIQIQQLGREEALRRGRDSTKI
jgi:hypothetical protein